ncbi:hypothetical protein SAY87_032337 [Trapa incisa]|uniref:Uncharacterized protein n=1 Tax=Trapa incisa TaxID=236973 RepID=A0AAN7G983_9MYRT|nr:hypothetical protein SAY87_032337 [Trapa incisa]
MRIPSTLSSFTVGTFSLASGSSVHQLIPRRHSGNADISHEEYMEAIAKQQKPPKSES